MRLGNYEIIRKIATGGMAEIFLARDVEQPGSAELAVKRMLPLFDEDEDLAEMFVDEARIAAKLNHPNIARVYGLGAEKGLPYIVMEYIHGDDLRHICERGLAAHDFIPIPLACRVICEVAQGLFAAHSQRDSRGRSLGIIHRDVSPQNLLVSMAGETKIVDFGIAKAANRISTTRAGQLKGKFSYMSPEQVTGRPVDHRSDLFALGTVLYEVTVAKRLFKGGNEIKTMGLVGKAQVTPPTQERADYPRRLEPIVLKALARDPNDRYQTADALRQDLELYLCSLDFDTSAAALAAYMRRMFPEKTGGLAPERSWDEVSDVEDLPTVVWTPEHVDEALNPGLVTIVDPVRVPQSPIPGLVGDNSPSSPVAVDGGQKAPPLQKDLVAEDRSSADGLAAPSTAAPSSQFRGQSPPSVARFAAKESDEGLALMGREGAMLPSGAADSPQNEARSKILTGKPGGTMSNDTNNPFLAAMGAQPQTGDPTPVQAQQGQLSAAQQQHLVQQQQMLAHQQQEQQQLLEQQQQWATQQERLTAEQQQQLVLQQQQLLAVQQQQQQQLLLQQQQQLEQQAQQQRALRQSQQLLVAQQLDAVMPSGPIDHSVDHEDFEGDLDRRKKKNRSTVIGVIVGLLVVGGIIFAIFGTSKIEETVKEETSPDDPYFGKGDPDWKPLATFPVEVRSEPEGARVIVNGLRQDGVTPGTFLFVEDQANTVAVFRDGFIPVHRFLAFGEDVSNGVDLKLDRIPDPPPLPEPIIPPPPEPGQEPAPIVQPEPNPYAQPTSELEVIIQNPVDADAMIWLDGKQMGKPPIKESIAKGAYHIVSYEKEGKAPHVVLFKALSPGEMVKELLSEGVYTDRLTEVLVEPAPKTSKVEFNEEPSSGMAAVPFNKAELVRIVVTSEGYEPWQYSLDTTGAGNFSVRATLSEFRTGTAAVQWLIPPGKYWYPCMKRPQGPVCWEDDTALAKEVKAGKYTLKVWEQLGGHASNKRDATNQPEIVIEPGLKYVFEMDFSGEEVIITPQEPVPYEPPPPGTDLNAVPEKPTVKPGKKSK